MNEARLIGNTRTLGVFPCGGCRAYVPVASGCEHLRPPGATLPAVMVQPVGRKSFEDRTAGELWYAAYRLADSKLSRAVVAHVAAMESPRRGATLTDKRWRDVANRLCRSGLLKLNKRGGVYRTTAHGREVWKRAQQLA